MRVRALDSNGDWLFGKGQNDYLTQMSAVAQDIQTNCYMFFGNCFFSQTGWIDWLNYLGSKNYLALSLAVTSQILNTNGVLSIISSSANLNAQARQLTLTYVVNTIFGQVTVPISSQEAQNFLLTESGEEIETEGGEGILA